MTGIDFFKTNFGNLQICKLLQGEKEETLVAWELEKAMECSPCPVDNEEILIRQIFSPIHYDTESNTLTPTAFEDAANKGLSVNRLNYSSEEEIHCLATDRANEYNVENTDRSPRSFAGIIQFICKDIRNITATVDNSILRGFVVYDTSDPNDISHADICQIVKNKQAGRSIRSKIRDLANSYLAVNPF